MYQPFLPFDPEYRAWEQARVDEKRRLRRSASFVGTLSLSLTLVMEVIFTVVVIVMARMGMLSAEDLSDPFLGLGNTAYLILYSCIYTSALLIPSVVVALCFGERKSPFSPTSATPVGFVILIIVGAVGMCMLSNIVNSFVLAIFSEVGLEVPDAPQMMEDTPTSFLLNLFVIAVLPALLEEMIYRGYILRVLRGHGDVYAILVSSMLFSLMHGNLRQIPFAFIVGMVLGYVYVVTDNIWVPIAIHFANNAISVVMEYFSFSLSVGAQNAFYGIIIYGLAAVGVFSVIFLCICYHRRMRVAKQVGLLSASDRFIVLFSTPLFLVSLALYLILLLMEIGV